MVPVDVDGPEAGLVVGNDPSGRVGPVDNGPDGKVGPVGPVEPTMVER